MLGLATLVLAGLLGALCLAWAGASRRRRYWADKGVPHLKPTLLTGNIGKVLAGKQQLHQMLDETYFAFPDAKAVGAWALHRPVLVLRDLDIIKHVLIKDFNNFVNRGFRPDMRTESVGARAMFALKDDLWRTVRHKLSPVFTSGKMKIMFPLMANSGEELVDTLTEECRKADGEPVDIADLNSRYTIDVITSCAFGCNGGALSDPKGSMMYRVFSGILNLSWKQGLAFMCMFFAGPRVYSVVTRLGVVFYEKEKLSAVYRMVEAEEQERAKGKSRPDAFQLTLELRDQERKAGVPASDSVFEGDYLAAHALQFLLAGSETSSSTMTYAMFELSRQPDLQERVRQQVRDSVRRHGGKLDYEALHDMPLVDLVLNEAMRLYPVLPFLDREAQADYHIPGTDIILKKGTKVFVPVSGLQRDPQYFPNPDKFDPERWLPERAAAGDSNKDAFLPFGAGPRFCIGNRFALVSMKVGLCNTLLRFELVAPPETCSQRLLEFNPKSVNITLQDGLNLVLREIVQE